MRELVSTDRDDVLHQYMDSILDEWNFHIDHEDGSTAPFTSKIMEELCLKS